MTRLMILGMLSTLVLFPYLSLSQVKETPLKVTPCELKNNPDTYNQSLVEVTGVVTIGYEDFTLHDRHPYCPDFPGIWLRYGGVEFNPLHSRPEPLVVENFTIPFVNDEVFQRFNRIIRREPNAHVHATLLGRFFSGKAGPLGRSYGHLNCCSLLAIQQVLAVADPKDLDPEPFNRDTGINYFGSASCLLTSFHLNEWIVAQSQAERGQHWAFEDPKRVASRALEPWAKNSAIPVSALKEARQAQGRIVYEWRPKKQGKTYFVVVSRPYLLTLYAQNPDRIVWIAVAVYVSSCWE